MDNWGIDELINKGGIIIMNNDKLTPSQEDIICDLPYHEKKCEEKIERKKRKYKAFPVNPERLDFILKKIGRKKL